jgi:hypothetical protein
MFWIGFTDEPLLDAELGEVGQVGLLKLGTHEERFVAHLEEWQRDEYAEHWRVALVRALKGVPSALVTDMWTPVQSSHLVWWPLWRIGGDLVFHNQLLFFHMHGINGPHVDIEKLFPLIGEHLSRNDEGTPLSEWRVPVADVQTFLTSNPGQLH